MLDAIGAGDGAMPALTAHTSKTDALAAPVAVFDITCVDADGNEKWRERVRNVVTTAGKTDILDKYLKGSAYTAAWYLLLAGTGTKSASDTLGSHAGWSEVTPYTGDRPQITWGTTAAGSNTSSAVSISITEAGPTTVAGAGICTAESGTSGVLYNVADFAQSRVVIAGDTLNITVQLSIT